MANQKASLQFDHKEIAVIFSLFVFVALLMFTVGIIVGKGLTLSKYEGKVAVDAGKLASQIENGATFQPNAGTSVSTEREVSSTQYEAPAVQPQREEPQVQLIPKEEGGSAILGDTLLEPESTQDYRDLLKNPRIKSLLENGGTDTEKAERPSRRNTASVAPTSDNVPKSFANGEFTVQIASYPSQQNAIDRVNQLKQMGFEHAYFSAKKLPNKNSTWFRVWLGFYPNFQTAKANAVYLQNVGEVKNYLLRKTSDVDK